MKSGYATAPVDIDLMTGDEFEMFVAQLIGRNGFQDVRVTKASGDYGVDVLGRSDGALWAFQCKCYHGSVGPKSVQEVHAGAAMYDAKVRVVVTNRQFTKNARELASRLGVLLWDRDTVFRMMREGGGGSVTVGVVEKKESGSGWAPAIMAGLSLPVLTILECAKRSGGRRRRRR